MGAEQLGLSWQPQRTSVVSLICTICIKGPPRQFRIVGSLTPTIDANFRNDCPRFIRNQRLSLSTTARILAFFRVTLPRWHTRTFVRLF